MGAVSGALFIIKHARTKYVIIYAAVDTVENTTL